MSHLDPSSSTETSRPQQRDSMEAASLSMEADVALSEAGSLNELRQARNAIESIRASQSSATARAAAANGAVPSDMLDQRMRERTAQLRQQDHARTANLLSSAPFHAASNATSSSLVDGGQGDLDAASPMPFDTREWADFFERLAPELGGVARHLESHTMSVAKAIRHAQSPGNLEGFRFEEPDRRYVAIVGCRGVGRGAVFQAFTDAGSITNSDAVGSKMLPIVLRHDDSCAGDAPCLPASQVRRVWLPLRAALKDAGTSKLCKPMVDAAFKRYPELSAVDKILGDRDWTSHDADVTGDARIVELVSYAHTALLCLAKLGRADKTLFDIFDPSANSTSATWGRDYRDGRTDAATSGPPEVLMRFPWLRGSNVPMALLDVPMPDEPKNFMAKTVEALLHRSITTVVVEEAFPVTDDDDDGSGGGLSPGGPINEGATPLVPTHAKSSVVAPHDVASPAGSSSSAGFGTCQTATQSSSAAGFGGPEALWRVLRTYAEKRREERTETNASANATETLSQWDADLPPAIIVALTLPRHGCDWGSLDPARVAIGCHVRLRRDFGVSVSITDMFVVAPVAAGAVVRLFDMTAALVRDEVDDDGAPAVLAHSTSASLSGSAKTAPQRGGDSASPDVNRLMAQLDDEGLLEPWRACLLRSNFHSTGAGPLSPMQGSPAAGASTSARASAFDAATASSHNTGHVAVADDLCSLLHQNETVWRMSALGWLVSSLLQHVVANHTAPRTIRHLQSVLRVVDDMSHCCAEMMLQNDVYATTSSVPYELTFTNHVRSAVGPASGLLKQLLASVEEQCRKWEDRMPAPGASPTARGAPGDLSGAESQAAAEGFTGTITTAVESAQERVKETRLNLAHIIRTKLALVTATQRRPGGGGGEADGSVQNPSGGQRERAASAKANSGSSSVVAPPAIALQAMDALGKRAAAALQGTTIDVGVVAEALRAWWHSLPEESRIGNPDGDAVAFKVSANEAAVRLAFGIPELATELAENNEVVGNGVLNVATSSLSNLGTNPVLKAALASKAARVSSPPDWSALAPPRPTATISHTVSEHSHLNASLSVAASTSSGARSSRRAQQQPVLLRVHGIEYQTHRELHHNLCAVQRYLREALGVTVQYEEQLQAIATAALVQRFGEVGRKELAIPTSKTKDGQYFSPLIVAFTAFQTLSSAIHDALAAQHHVLAASIVRPDDQLAHFSIDANDNIAALLHSVGRLYESRAEWRRWRVAYHSEVARAAADTVTVCQPVALRFLPDHLKPPRLELSISAGATNKTGDGPASAVSRGLPSPAGAATPTSSSRSRSSVMRPTPAHIVGNRKKAVLCLCGGGVRGVLSAIFVQRLDSMIQAKFSVPGKRRVRIWDVVDEFYGTSTGAIIAALLSIGIEPSAIVDLYKNHAADIFPQSHINTVAAAAKPKYDPAGRHEIARRFMGRRRMSDQTVYAGIARPKLLTCDLSNLKTKVFNDTDDVSFVDVLMAATAAPTFFPAVKIGSTFFCDGGIAENHPGLEVAKDLRNVEYVATIGTGMAPMNYQHLHNAGLLHWAPCFVDVFVDSSQTAADDVLRAVFGEERSDLINLTLPPVKMNLDDPSTIPVLVDLAADYVKDSKEVFARIADKLHSTVTHGSSTGQRRGGGNTAGANGGGGSQGDEEPETPY